VTIGAGPRLGWWLVDPSTGATVDMLDDGRGATLEEAAYLMLAGAMVAALVIALGLCLGRVSASIEGFLNAHPGSSVGDVPIRSLACGG
jgi:hypothetical protein